MKKPRVDPDGGRHLEDNEPQSKEVVRTLVAKIRGEILLQTTLRKKKVSFKEDAEEFRAGLESGEWMMHAKRSEG